MINEPSDMINEQILVVWPFRERKINSIFECYGQNYDHNRLPTNRKIFFKGLEKFPL